MSIVTPDPDELVVVPWLEVLPPLLAVPLLLVPLPLVLLVLLLHAVSNAPVATSAAQLVIVSDLFMGYLMGFSWNASLR